MKIALSIFGAFMIGYSAFVLVLSVRFRTHERRRITVIHGLLIMLAGIAAVAVLAPPLSARVLVGVVGVLILGDAGLRYLARRNLL